MDGNYDRNGDFYRYLCVKIRPLMDGNLLLTAHAVLLKLKSDH